MKNALLSLLVLVFMVVSCSRENDISYNVNNVEFAKKSPADVSVAMNGLLEAVETKTLETTETDVPSLPTEKWSIETEEINVQVYPNPDDPYEYFDSSMTDYSLAPVEGIGVQYEKSDDGSALPYAIAPYRTVQTEKDGSRVEYYFWVKWEDAQDVLPETVMMPLRNIVE